ncbi:CaiB/BaiF CoA transferase family protein [Hydrogenophaga sp. OTU3427]|uniref:CaiB/BaiF CoA transferase family protein n=1 Tax=Hydrogenophaga sp. OTU3427 TaxID=3043856 RepID=UPI00313DA04B
MPESTATADPTPDAALRGVRVVDLTTVIFGPYATQTLADYGADVIKIETPDGDSTRFNGPAREKGMGSLFLGSNRNKRSVVLNLKQAAAREALLALTDTADVFIHNVRPQKLAGLGLSAEAMRARNPRLIFVGLHGFGDGGPYAGAPAYDDIVQGLSGAADLVQRQSGESRYFPTVAADKICGQMAVHAVIAALYQRERTGAGQVIEVPMFESMVSFLLVEHFYARHLSAQGDAQPARPEDLGYPRTLAPSRRPYRTADGHACVMPYTDENWRRFFEAIGQPGLATDPRFANITARTQNIAELLSLMAGILEKQSTAHWITLCEALDVPCAPVNRLEDLEQDSHLRAVGLFESVKDGAEGDYRFTRSPIKLGASVVPAAMPPRLGEHTAQVLGELGLAPELLKQLLPADSPVAQPPVQGSDGT